MKKITFKKMKEIHPEFEFVRTNDTGHISIAHKETGKTVVCIIGDRVMDYNNFVTRVKENPEMINQSSYFRMTTPNCDSPYKKGQTVKVVATENEIHSHFGADQKFCSTGDELSIKDFGWSDSSEEWQPSFDNPNDFGGFWLQPEMIQAL
jgi:hypothetical protein